MKVSNVARGTVLADSCQLAASYWARFRGLLFRSPLATGEGLLLRPCQAVHTFMMGFPIDVLFLDEDNRIVHAIESMSPYRASRIVSRARSVLELPAGTVSHTGTSVGDRLTLEGE